MRGAPPPAVSRCNDCAVQWKFTALCAVEIVSVLKILASILPTFKKTFVMANALFKHWRFGGCNLIASRGHSDTAGGGFAAVQTWPLAFPAIYQPQP